MSDVGSARRAKDELKTKISNEPWCVGVGVEREDGVGFVVRVNVRSGRLTEAQEHVPARMGNVVVKIVETDA
jgi:hypothetical protein